MYVYNFYVSMVHVLFLSLFCTYDYRNICFTQMGSYLHYEMSLWEMYEKKRERKKKKYQWESLRVGLTSTTSIVKW